MALYIGRFYEDMGQLEEARDALHQNLVTREKNNKIQGPYSEDAAALYFNAACYARRMARSAEDVKNASLVEKFLNLAWDELQSCIKLHPADFDEAKTDPDLKDLPTKLGRTFDDLAA